MDCSLIIINRQEIKQYDNKTASLFKKPCHDNGSIRSELSEILRACERSHCPAEILLKDISTVGHRLDHLITWERIAMELVNNGL